MALNYSIDFLFFIDILVNFNSAFLDPAFVMVDDRKKIAAQYLKNWFFIDLIAIIPFDLIMSAIAES